MRERETGREGETLFSARPGVTLTAAKSKAFHKSTQSWLRYYYNYVTLGKILTSKSQLPHLYFFNVYLLRERKRESQAGSTLLAQIPDVGLELTK